MLHPFFERRRLLVLITQVVAFSVVIIWAIKPGATVPLLRAGLILYALGLTP